MLGVFHQKSRSTGKIAALPGDLADGAKDFFEAAANRLNSINDSGLWLGDIKRDIDAVLGLLQASLLTDKEGFVSFDRNDLAVARRGIRISESLLRSNYLDYGDMPDICNLLGAGKSCLLPPLPDSETEMLELLRNIVTGDVIRLRTSSNGHTLIMEDYSQYGFRFLGDIVLLTDEEILEQITNHSRCEAPDITGLQLLRSIADDFGFFCHTVLSKRIEEMYSTFRMAHEMACVQAPRRP